MTEFLHGMFHRLANKRENLLLNGAIVNADTAAAPLHIHCRSSHIVSHAPCPDRYRADAGSCGKGMVNMCCDGSQR